MICLASDLASIPCFSRVAKRIRPGWPDRCPAGELSQAQERTPPLRLRQGARWQRRRCPFRGLPHAELPFAVQLLYAVCVDFRAEGVGHYDPLALAGEGLNPRRPARPRRSWLSGYGGVGWVEAIRFAWALGAGIGGRPSCSTVDGLPLLRAQSGGMTQSPRWGNLSRRVSKGGRGRFL